MPAAAGRYKWRLLSPLDLRFWGQDKAGPSTAPIPPLHHLHAHGSSLFWAREPQSQHIALMVHLDEGSQMLYLFCCYFAACASTCCLSKTHGAIVGICIVPTATGNHDSAGALCHFYQIYVTRFSGTINPHSSASLAEFVNLRPRFHQLWTRCLLSLWLLSALTCLPAHRHHHSFLPSVKIRAGTDAWLCPAAGTRIDTAGTGTRQPRAAGLSIAQHLQQ